MTNDEVISELEKILIELEKRRIEMEMQLGRTDTPIDQWFDFDLKVNARIGSLNARIVRVRTRIRQRKLIRELGQSVKELSQGSKNTMSKALAKIQESIVSTAAVKDAIRLASAISDAASRAVDVTEPQPT